MRGKFLTGVVPSLRFLLHHPGFSGAPLRSLSRVASWYGLVALGVRPSLQVAPWNACFTLPRKFRSPAKVFYVFRRQYEKEIRFLEKYLEPGDVFIDGGANFGLYTVLASRLIGETGKVFAFEPFPDSFQLVTENVRRNQLKNVELFPIALSDRGGQAHLGVHEDPGRNSLALDPGETLKKISVEKNTVDSLWMEKGLPLPTIIKLDVEGHEFRALLGAQGVLRKSFPTILFELNPAAWKRAGETPGALTDMLTNIGYSFFAFEDGLLSPAVPESGDFAAVHSSRIPESRMQSLLLATSGGRPSAARLSAALSIRSSQ